MAHYRPIPARGSRDYLNGYRAGYQDGIAAGLAGQTDEPQVLQLPLEHLELSVRALHCLTQAGCLRIGDVARLSQGEIHAMPRLGRVTADEIARALHRRKIYQTAWAAFLLNDD